jgi:hypothetical protein
MRREAICRKQLVRYVSVNVQWHDPSRFSFCRHSWLAICYSQAMQRPSISGRSVWLCDWNSMR